MKGGDALGPFEKGVLAERDAIIQHILENYAFSHDLDGPMWDLLIDLRDEKHRG